MKQPIDWKQIIISILVGAVVAFLSALIDGLQDVLSGYGNDLLGGSTATALYALKRVFRVL